MGVFGGCQCKKGECLCLDGILAMEGGWFFQCRDGGGDWKFRISRALGPSFSVGVLLLWDNVLGCSSID